VGTVNFRGELLTSGIGTTEIEEMDKPIIDDELWALIEPLLPPSKPRREKNPGRLPVSNRAALTGILFVLKTGLRWRDLPAEMGCGSGVTCWRRLRDWQAAGVWDRLHALLLAKLRAADQIDFSRAAVDSSSIRAVGAGQKLGQTQQIARDPVPSTTSSPTPTARRLPRS
jgi:transposase